jgi:glutathione synthase
MPDLISNAIIDDAVAQALQLNLCFLDGPGKARHVPFSFTPCPLPAAVLAQLEFVAPLLGRLTQALAEDDTLLQDEHAALAPGDPFFAEMLSTHRVLHSQPGTLLRMPLLLQRSDFMVDASLGPQLVECNSIAAGMAPFGDRMGSLHQYLQERWPSEFARWHTAAPGTLHPNPAIANMGRAIANAAHSIALDLGGGGQPSFLMVIQENEDNVFDQRLLENELRSLGLQTHRRTFRQLQQQLSSGPNQSLQLEGCGTVHVVYLRAGYQFRDYVATDLDTRRCCDALLATRMFIERHRVALNATVAQQLATSKRMQMRLSGDDGSLLQRLGFAANERAALLAVLAPMHSVNADTATRLRDEGNLSAWVLKNQGEGGGHCLFDQDILHRLDTLGERDFGAWTLMQRLLPAGRDTDTLLVRDGRARTAQRLVSEIGLFSAHLGGEALETDGHHEGHRPGHIGHLVRSKPPTVSEGGIHSGFGVLDSLFIEQ